LLFTRPAGTVSLAAAECQLTPMARVAGFGSREANARVARAACSSISCAHVPTESWDLLAASVIMASWSLVTYRCSFKAMALSLIPTPSCVA
jgi:hypothetical protein